MAKSHVPGERITGKHTGATRLPDGRIEMAPMHQDSFTELANRRTALNEMMRSVMRFEIEELTRIARDQQRWWESVAEDLGFDAHEAWQCDGKFLKPPAELVAENAPASPADKVDQRRGK